MQQACARSVCGPEKQRQAVRGTDQDDQVFFENHYAITLRPGPGPFEGLTVKNLVGMNLLGSQELIATQKIDYFSVGSTVFGKTADNTFGPEIPDRAAGNRMPP